MDFERTVFCIKFSSNVELCYDIQFLRFFHECDLYGYLIFDCETSKQLEHKKVEML